MKLADIAIDTEKEAEGVWQDVPTGDGWRIKLRGVDCPAGRERARKNRARIERARTHGADEDTLEKLRERLGTEMLCEVLIADWDLVEDTEGVKLEFTPAVGLTLLTDPRYRTMLRDVVALVGREHVYLQSQQESDLLDSRPPSNGGFAGATPSKTSKRQPRSGEGQAAS